MINTIFISLSKVSAFFLRLFLFTCSSWYVLYDGDMTIRLFTIGCELPTSCSGGAANAGSACFKIGASGPLSLFTVHMHATLTRNLFTFVGCTINKLQYIFETIGSLSYLEIIITQL
jgi:hypothetical protein